MHLQEFASRINLHADHDTKLSLSQARLVLLALIDDPDLAVFALNHIAKHHEVALAPGDDTIPGEPAPETETGLPEEQPQPPTITTTQTTVWEADQPTHSE